MPAWLTSSGADDDKGNARNVLLREAIPQYPFIAQVSARPRRRSQGASPRSYTPPPLNFSHSFSCVGKNVGRQIRFLYSTYLQSLTPLSLSRAIFPVPHSNRNQRRRREAGSEWNLPHSFDEPLKKPRPSRCFIPHHCWLLVLEVGEEGGLGKSLKQYRPLKGWLRQTDGRTRALRSRTVRFGEKGSHRVGGGGRRGGGGEGGG